MPFGFRISFRLSPDHRLNLESRWVLLTPEDVLPAVIIAAAESDKEAKDTPRLVVRSDGYDTEDEARQVGDWLRDVLRLAFVSIRVAADLGDRRRGVFTKYFLENASAEVGRPVLNDFDGLTTFETYPPPAFIRLGATLTVGTGEQRFVSVFRSVLDALPLLTDRVRLACDLFSASRFENSGEARFITLVMAVEALIETRPRPAPAQALVRAFVEATRASQVDKRDKDSLVGVMRWCFNESISQAGRRLASQLGGKKYYSMDPEKFFSECYDIRSGLVHGAVPRPTGKDIGDRLTALEEFVSDLIAYMATK